jgi:CPA1 family monovalent cation:H+ antiporter
VLILVFAVYAVSDMVEHESGLLAVTIMGMTLSNMKNTDISDILDFKESLSVLLISGLFIILAARMDLAVLLAMGWPSLWLLAAILFLSRPLAVFVSALGSDLELRERLMIAWIGPRGIVAAAISAVFAIRLESIGMAGAELLVPITFLVIIGTVVIQSATAKPLARWLGVREPPPRGVLITGAGIVARAIGKAIQEHGFKVLLTDSNWENTSLARKEGMDTYYGNPVSEHADRNLVLVGIGKMLGMSGRTDLDSLAAQKFKAEFGAQNVYELVSARDNVVPEKHRVSMRHRGRQLFGEYIDHATIAGWLRAGAKIQTVKLTEEYNFQNYLDSHPDHCVPLFAIDPRERLHFFTVDEELSPEADWKVVNLILPEDETYRLDKDEEEEKDQDV